MNRRPIHIRPCCGAPDSGQHAGDCRTFPYALRSRSGGPYCIARRCNLVPLHRAGTAGCALTVD